MPLQAVISHPGIAFDPAQLAAIAAALSKAGLHERAGDFAAAQGRPADALGAYRKGGAYRKAVELARTAAPAQVRDYVSASSEHHMRWVHAVARMCVSLPQLLTGGMHQLGCSTWPCNPRSEPRLLPLTPPPGGRA